MIVDDVTRDRNPKSLYDRELTFPESCFFFFAVAAVMRRGGDAAHQFHRAIGILCLSLEVDREHGSEEIGPLDFVEDARAAL